MITQAHRFHGRSSLRFVYLRGQTVRAGAISLKYALNTRQGGYRVAVVVSRKVSKSAVVRNRIRRRMYEIIRNRSKLITAPYDLVFTAYDESTATVSHQQLQQSVVGALTRAGVINRSEHAIVESKETSA
ncbi:MAG TPA: ribonuclease P protein component [Bacillota bacterium]|nr:ribonuclease P protein component [Bacillota bacterium]